MRLSLNASRSGVNQGTQVLLHDEKFNADHALCGLMARAPARRAIVSTAGAAAAHNPAAERPAGPLQRLARCHLRLHEAKAWSRPILRPGQTLRNRLQLLGIVLCGHNLHRHCRGDLSRPHQLLNHRPIELSRSQELGRRLR